MPEQNTPPAVSEAMREAVARVLSQTLDVACRIPPDCCPGALEGVADAADALCAPTGPIASEIARLTGEREAALELVRRARESITASSDALDLAKAAMLQDEATIEAAEAETARLRAALEDAADALGWAGTALREDSNDAAAGVTLTAANNARAALTSQEKTDA